MNEMSIFAVGLVVVCIIFMLWTILEERKDRNTEDAKLHFSYRR